jgi:hypothetical protein
VRLPAELLDALHRRAADEGVTVSEFARRTLADAAHRSPEPGSVHAGQLTGPLGLRLTAHRREVLDVAAAHRLTNVRVFGSVARGEDRPDSDVDLLVDIPEGMGFIGLGRARADLERVLGADVDLIPAADLKEDVSLSIASDVVPL